MTPVPLFLPLTLGLAATQAASYADAPTAALVARARTRHTARSTEIARYTARVFTRIDLSHAPSRFGKPTPLGAVEYEATVDWSRDGDVEVEYVGLRKKYGFRLLPGPLPFFDIDQDDLEDPRADDLWFLPHRLGDEVWIVCCDFQERPALHPLAAGAERFYRYAIADSLRLDLPERSVDVVAVDVVPLDDRRELLLGRMWIDRETGDVVRFVMRLVGERLFDDHRGSILNRVFNLEGEIEYALVDGYWLPSQQSVTLEADDPWITKSVMPLRFHTEFRDYTIETGSAVAAREPAHPLLTGDSVVAPSDSTEPSDTPEVTRARDVLARLREGARGGRVSIDMGELRDAIAVLRREGITETWSTDGSLEGAGRTGRTERNRSWRIVSPPLDSLEQFDGWDAPLRITPDAASEESWRDTRRILTELSRSVPDSVDLARNTRAVEYGEIFRFNRVQGVALGGGYRYSPPSMPFLTGRVQARVGLDDQRPTIGVTLTREGASGSRELRAGRFLEDGDPFVDGRSFGNSLNALVTGHDDADYYLAEGAQVRFSGITGAAGEWSIRLAGEHHRSMAASPSKRPNPPIADGWWATAAVGLRGGLDAISIDLGTELHTDGTLALVRAWTRVRPVLGDLSFALLAGTASRDDIPQFQWRAGGPATVRGYDYGARSGSSFWAVQAEYALSRVPRAVPILFADAGTAGRPGELFTADPLVGVGVGVAFPLLLTELRFELSKAVGPGSAGPVRFDIRFRT